MESYDLAELINSASDAELPRIVERLSTEREYKKIIRKMLRETGGDINRTLLVQYVEQMENDDLTTEALMLAVFWTLSQATATAISEASALVAAEARYIDGKFITGVKAATGFDVSAVVRPEDLDGFVDALVKRNVSLITEVSEQTRQRIERAVVDAQLKQKPVSELKSELRDILGKQAKRADLIATDQLEKLSTQVVARRAKQAGLTQYVWHTQGDSKVRPAHAALNGTLQDTSNSSHGDGGQLPREPIRCRCYATWVVPSNK